MKILLILCSFVICLNVIGQNSSTWVDVQIGDDRPNIESYVTSGCRLDPGFNAPRCNKQIKYYDSILKNWESKHGIAPRFTRGMFVAMIGDTLILLKESVEKYKFLKIGNSIYEIKNL